MGALRRTSVAELAKVIAPHAERAARGRAHIKTLGAEQVPQERPDERVVIHGEDARRRPSWPKPLPPQHQAV